MAGSEQPSGLEAERGGRDAGRRGATVTPGNLPGAAPQLRQVLDTFPCSEGSAQGYPVWLPSADDPKQCYGLTMSSMLFVPRLAQVDYDATQGYLIDVSVSDADRAAFTQLTRKVAAAQSPKNQLAIILDGRVITAPTVTESIVGRSLQITAGSDKPFTQAYTEQLAAELTR